MIGLAEAAAGVEDGFTAVRTLFEALARAQPLVLVFDDIHWGEATFLDLVEHLADWTRDAPILLVCLARPELLDVRPGLGRRQAERDFGPARAALRERMRRLIENLVGQDELADEVETRIAEAAEGNPLFVEEMLSMLIDDGLLVRRDGRWTAGGTIRAVPVPPTIHALLAARLDRLERRRAGRDRAGRGRGEGLPRSGNRGARPGSRYDRRSGCARGARAQGADPAGAAEPRATRTYRFRHLLIRDAAYDSIPEDDARRSCTSASRAGSNAQQATGRRLRGNHRLPPRAGVPATAASSGPVDDATRVLSAGRRPSGSARQADAPSSGATRRRL